MLSARFDALPDYPFPRLRALLKDRSPGAPDGEVHDFSIGEPRHPPPAFVLEDLHRARAGYGRYPPIDGTPEFREAVGHWLARRYALPTGFLDPHRQILPVNGTREALFLAALALVPPDKSGRRPAVLMPNPFYQCYAAAALAAGADPVFCPATAETGFLPDFDAVPEETLTRTAAVYLCSPANPQGAAADLGAWQRLLALAETHGFTVFADECYSEIYSGAPPPGALEAAAIGGHDPDRLLVFHSLSKRSNLPGLRSGFVAGGPAAIAAFRQLRAYGGAPSPLPVLAAAAAAWRDEVHVGENRALYDAKFDLAGSLLETRFGYRRPNGGFFLWLDVGDGENAALTLWERAGVKVLPGGYLGREQDGGNPGAAYIRVALVDSLERTKIGLERIVETLSGA